MTKKKYVRSIQPDVFLKKTIKNIHTGVLFGAFLAILSYFFYGKILLSAFLLVLVAIYDFLAKKSKETFILFWGSLLCVLAYFLLLLVFWWLSSFWYMCFIAFLAGSLILYAGIIIAFQNGTLDSSLLMPGFLLTLIPLALNQLHNLLR